MRERVAAVDDELPGLVMLTLPVPNVPLLPPLPTCSVPLVMLVAP